MVDLQIPVGTDAERCHLHLGTLLVGFLVIDQHAGRGEILRHQQQILAAQDLIGLKPKCELGADRLGVILFPEGEENHLHGLLTAGGQEGVGLRPQNGQVVTVREPAEASRWGVRSWIRCRMDKRFVQVDEKVIQMHDWRVVRLSSSSGHINPALDGGRYLR